MPEPSKTRLYVFCSDRPRNGKTLLCRLFCGSVPDADSGSFRVFDTEFPEGNIAGQFPDNTEIVDFSRTLGRVHLFDTVLAGEHRYFLVDLQHALLSDFFTTLDDIGFAEEAASRGIHLVVYYMLDRSSRSLERAQEIYQLTDPGEFFLVANETIGQPDLRDVSPPVQKMLSLTRVLRLPFLTDPLIGLLEEPSFSLSNFIAGDEQGTTYDQRLELWNLLEFLYQQRTPDNQGITHFL